MVVWVMNELCLLHVFSLISFQFHYLDHCPMTNLHLIIQRNSFIIDQCSVAATKILKVVSPVSEAYNSMTPRDHCVRNEDLAICQNKCIDQVVSTW